MYIVVLNGDKKKWLVTVAHAFNTNTHFGR